MKKAVTAACALLLCLFFSSCSFIQMNITDLMKPPKLSKEQTQVYNALMEELHTDSVSLKYPRSGNYRSAFVFYDIDGDNVEEAIVFYKLSPEDAEARINILDYDNGTWRSVYDVPGEGSGDVDYITFENISSKDYKNIIIGWEPQNTRDKLVSIYSYEDGKLVTQFDSKYTQSLIQDLNGDGLMDLLLISLRRYTVSLVSLQGGEIRVVNEFEISDDFQSISQLISGRLPDGRQGVFMDVTLKGEYYATELATEIITVENNRLTPLIDVSAVYSGESGDITELQQKNFESTLRSEEILSADVNRDGVIEVPSSQVLLGYEELPREEQKFLTTFSVMRDGEMVPVMDASVNVGAGYLIRFPEKWVDSVSVVAENNVTQWRYIKYGGNLSDQSVELLRISKVSQNDYQDKFDKQPVLLAQKGAYQFLGYIPTGSEAKDLANEAGDLLITESDLKGMFYLL